MYAKPYKMKMVYKHNNKLLTTMYVDLLTCQIKIENHTDDIICRAFGINEDPTWDDFDYFLRSRCFEETRQDVKLLLSELGLDHFDPLAIVEKTKGRCTDDPFWLDISYI